MSAGYFHYSVRARSRSEGFNALLYAAYITGEKLEDEREQVIHAMGDARRVVHHEIIAGDSMPKWVERVVADRDHEALWNRAEGAETRKNSVLCRDIKLSFDDGLFIRREDGSLDREASMRLQRAILRDHVERMFVDRGMVASIAIHWDPHTPTSNPHAHVMLTTRLVDERGMGEKEGGKSRPWKENRAEEWRQDWAQSQNRALERMQAAYRLDHRSYERQGLDLDAEEKHFGRGEKKRKNERIHARQAEKLLRNCRPILDAITKSYVDTFSEKDVELFVRRFTRRTGKTDQLLDAVKNSSELVELPSGKFTTRGIQARAVRKEIEGTLEQLHCIKSWGALDESLLRRGFRLEATQRDGKQALDIVSAVDPGFRMSAFRVDKILGAAYLAQRFGKTRASHEVDEVRSRREEAYRVLQRDIWSRMKLETRHDRQEFFAAWRAAREEQAERREHQWAIGAFVAEKLSRWTWQRRLRLLQQERAERVREAAEQAAMVQTGRDAGVSPGMVAKGLGRGRNEAEAQVEPGQRASKDAGRTQRSFQEMLAEWRQLQIMLEKEALQGRFYHPKEQAARNELAKALVGSREWQQYRERKENERERRTVEAQVGFEQRRERELEEEMGMGQRD